MDEPEGIHVGVPKGRSVNGEARHGWHSRGIRCDRSSYNVESFVVVQSLRHVQLFVTLWTIARQTPLSMGFSRQEYWSELPFPALGDLPDPGIEPGSPALAGGFT